MKGVSRLKNKVDVHVIAQSHLDLVWKWDREDAREMIYSTMKGYADKLRQNPLYTYSQSQIYIYEYILENHPGLFKEIKRLVQEGRWEIVGGEWVEPDHNLLDEESMVRQFLYGQKFVRKHFGRYVRTGWSPDGFGHNMNLPQIMKKVGIYFFVHKRPRQKFVNLPVTPYILKGIDGTRIIALRVNNKGAGRPKISEGYECSCSELEFLCGHNAKVGIADLWGPLGVGDTGGVNDYEQVTAGSYPELNFIFSTPQKYYDIIMEKADLLPVVDKELNAEYPACYTTRANIKKMHRLCELKLEQAEFFSTWAYTLGAGYPSEELQRLWKIVLYNEFHDAVTGTCIDPVHEQSVEDYRFVRYSCDMITEKALNFIAQKADTSVFKRPYIICNTASFERDEQVFVDVTLSSPEKNFTLQDSEGNVFKGTVVSDRLLDGHGNYHKLRILFHVSGIPACGYKIVGFASDDEGGEIEHAKPAEPAGTVTERLMENGHYRVELNEAGEISRLYDKGAGKEWNKEGCEFAYLEILHEGEYIPDYGKPHKAWNFGFTGVKERLSYYGAEVVEHSDCRMVLRQKFRYNNSQLESDIILYGVQKRLEFEIKLNWLEVEKYLGVNFPLNMGKEARVYCKVPFALIERNKT